MKHEIIKLENEIELILVPIEEVKTFSIRLVVEGAGYAYDIIKEGMNNLTFKMLQRGTAKYKSYNDINYQMESIGGYMSLGALSEYGYIQIDSPSANLEKSIDLISDLFLNPVFDQIEFNSQKSNIISEINALNSDPQEKTRIEFFKTIYEGTNYGGTGLGTVESVTNITREEVIKNHHGMVSGAPLRFFIIGKFDKKQVVALINKLFIKELNKKYEYKGYKLAYRIVDKIDKTKIVNIGSDLDQPIFFLGLQSVGMSSDDYYKAIVISAMLGSGFGSFMMSEVREKQSLAYYALASQNTNKYNGVLYAFAGVNKEKFYEAVDATIKQLKRIKEGDFEDLNMQRAINYKIGTIVVASEALSSKLNLAVNHYMATGEVFSHENYSKNLRKITKQDLVDFANENYNGNLCFVVNGFDKIDEKKLNKLMERF